MTPTNPPSVPSLDVEAPKTHAVQCREEGRPQDWWLFKAMTPEGKVSNNQSVDVEACVRLLKILAEWHNNAAHGMGECRLRDSHVQVDQMARALASALPGMGKAMEENESLRRDAERWRSRRKRPCLGTNGRMCLLEPGHDGPHKPPPVEPDTGSDL